MFALVALTSALKLLSFPFFNPAQFAENILRLLAHLLFIYFLLQSPPCLTTFLCLTLRFLCFILIFSSSSGFGSSFSLVSPSSVVGENPPSSGCTDNWGFSRIVRQTCRGVCLAELETFGAACPPDDQPHPLAWLGGHLGGQHDACPPDDHSHPLVSHGGLLAGQLNPCPPGGHPLICPEGPPDSCSPGGLLAGCFSSPMAFGSRPGDGSNCRCSCLATHTLSHFCRPAPLCLFCVDSVAVQYFQFFLNF